MNNNLVALDHKLRILLEENQECIERFENIHPEFYQYLLRKKFVIDDNVNEIDEAINLSRNYLNSKQTFYLIVNPTLDCNLRCWYCYETHLSSSIMDTTTMERVKRLMDRIISSSELVRFELGFFGGEPLMQFQSVVLPLIIYAQKACLRHQKELSIGFTSNGVYLTRPVVDKLTELMLTYRFQIPFDGNEYYHNKTKKYANGRGSYRRIIENVKYGATQGMVFNIRCNYTPENIASFKDLIAELEYLPSDIISFSFQRVWQTSETDDTRKVLTELDNMVAEGENAKKNNFDVIYSPCYADRANSVIVNYNGDVYKCTARDFAKTKREGKLNEDGTITYEESYYKRMNALYSNKTCQECIIFPICDVCSQKRLEAISTECLHMYTEKDKYRLIANCVKTVIMR